MENYNENFVGQLAKLNSNLNPDLVQPLVLAYIGDSVYDLYIRTMLINESNANVNKLHKESTSYVMAHAQSDIVHQLAKSLTEREQYIVKRGRNAKSATVPKNANITEYKYATGFEALIGYLYIKGEIQRLMEILALSVEISKGITQREKQNSNDTNENGKDKSNKQ